MKLISLLAQLALHLKNRKFENKSISEASIGWHLIHSLLVINNITESLLVSDPNKYVKEDNRVRDIVLTKKQIKRGVAHSPEAVTPGQEIKKGQIKDLLDQAKVNVVKFALIPKHAHFTHYSMGMLKKKEAIKFLIIHTKHHLKIINEIVESELVLRS
ncbi:MAG: hypothetical protein AAF693_16225 [Bacteroidota bacterium]